MKLDIHKDIIEAAKGGSRKAQSELYELYAKAIHRVMDRIGIEVQDFDNLYPKLQTEQELLAEIKRIGQDVKNTALLVLSPVPTQLNHYNLTLITTFKGLFLCPQDPFLQS